MTSLWVGDVIINTKQSCDQHPGYFKQDPGKPDLGCSNIFANVIKNVINF